MTCYVADGEHMGLRWWVHRHNSATMVTVGGFDGGVYVSESTEMPEASPRSVRQWVERVLADRRARRAKRTIAA